MKGEKLLHADMQITEIVIPVKETLAKARSYGVSITIFLTAMLLCSIHEEIPKNRQKRPIALMIPVNLRNYFPSQSMGNFFGWMCWLPRTSSAVSTSTSTISSEFMRAAYPGTMTTSPLPPMAWQVQLT